jgi:hypothetical protein
MKEDQMKPEGDVELHHQSIEEIMGTPPVKSIAVSSGIILVILLVLLGGSALVVTPDIMKTNAVIYGNDPVAVLTAPESGQIVQGEGYDFSEREVERGETLLHIRNAIGESIPVTAISSGALEFNPLVRIRGSVYRGDTVGYIWDKDTAPVACVIYLSRAEARNVESGNKIRLYLEPDDSDSVIETEVREKFELLTGNQMQIISVLPERNLPVKKIRGTVKISADIVVGRKSLFNRMINPFRGLERR